MPRCVVAVAIRQRSPECNGAAALSENQWIHCKRMAASCCRKGGAAGVTRPGRVYSSHSTCTHNACRPHQADMHVGMAAEFKGAFKEKAPQPKAPEPAPRLLQGSSLEEPDFGRFLNHSMPSRAEIFCLQLSVSKHVIAFTVNVSIKLDQTRSCRAMRRHPAMSAVICLGAALCQG